MINGFLIQSGGFEPGMKQRPVDAPIENEAHNGLRNDTYTVAMARTNDPHSPTAQFFINLNDNDFLKHCAHQAPCRTCASRRNSGGAGVSPPFFRASGGSYHGEVAVRSDSTVASGSTPKPSNRPTPTSPPSRPTNSPGPPRHP